MAAPPPARTVLRIVLALVVVVGLLVGGTWAWQRAHRTHLEAALRTVPASSLRVAFTDWELVRRELGVRVDASSGPQAVERFIDKAYDTDLSAASSIDASAAALQTKYGFSPATAQWEVFAQGKTGATMVLHLPDADFDDLAGNLRSLGYERPEEDDGVWQGGVDLVAEIDPTITPELQYVALLADRDLVVSSDSASYAAAAARVAAGDARSVAAVESVGDLADGLGEVANAMVWAGDFACSDLAMAAADANDQAQAGRLVDDAGGVTPLDGLAMGMASGRTLRVVAAFEDDEQAQKNLRPRARLAVGEAVGRGGSFADDFRLTSARSVGSTVRLTLEPKRPTGYVLSALYDGPLVFASC